MEMFFGWMSQMTAMAQAVQRLEERARPVVVPEAPADGRHCSRADAVRKSVTESTYKNYMSLVKSLRDLKYPATYHGLAARMNLNDHIAGCTLRNTISALQFHLRLHGHPEMTKEETHMLHFLADCRTRRMPQRKEKGTVTWERLKEWIGWMVRRGISNEVAWCAEVAWCTGLRACQMVQLRRYNLFKAEDGKWRIKIERVHDPTRRKRDHEQMLELHVHDNAAQTFDEWLPKYPAGALICPAWNHSQLNRLFHQAAEELKWDDRLAWHGVHQLRHGVLTDAKNSAGFAAARAISGHVEPTVSEGTISRYTFTDEERVKRQYQRGDSRSKLVEAPPCIVHRVRESGKVLWPTVSKRAPVGRADTQPQRAPPKKQSAKRKSAPTEKNGPPPKRKAAQPRPRAVKKAAKAAPRRGVKK